MERMRENFEQDPSSERETSEGSIEDIKSKLTGEYANMVGEMERLEREEGENWTEQKKFLVERMDALEKAISEEDDKETRKIDAEIRKAFPR